MKGSVGWGWGVDRKKRIKSRNKTIAKIVVKWAVTLCGGGGVLGKGKGRGEFNRIDGRNFTNPIWSLKTQKVLNKKNPHEYWVKRQYRKKKLPI